MSTSLRSPAVAGQFYPADPQELKALVTSCLADIPREHRHCRAAMVPHAGLMYSGRCAGAVLARLVIPPVVVILAPNHTGQGTPGASLWQRGSFLTPLGSVPVDSRLGARLAAACPLVRHDPAAHRFEHAVEVELPFLQTLAPATAVVPLVLGFDDWERSLMLAQALGTVVAEWPTEILLLASSDLTHHEPAAAAERKDRLALAAIERMDGRSLLETCHRERISMCGRAPAAVVVEAARRLGATRAELIDYRHSGVVTGDDTSVVSYAGVLIP
jgi:AmmeMemoRadiSam system protein B